MRDIGLSAGLYDRVIDAELRAQIESVNLDRLAVGTASIDPAELPDRVAEVAAAIVRASMKECPEVDRHDAAKALIDRVLSAAGITREHPGCGAALENPVLALLAIEPLSPAGTPMVISRPLTPLRDTVLMTNARGEPTIGSEILNEIDSADSIDLVLAFIRFTGIRLLLEPLRRHVAAGKPLRVITTTFTGTTELRALEKLVELGAEVKVSYDTKTTRLHAKAWMFRRRNGFSTVYVGSSNLTHSAQVDGKEWNVRASERLNPDLVTAFHRTFTTYWADEHFENFDPERFAYETRQAEVDTSILTPFDLQPYPFQRQILEQLQVQRLHGHAHNLVVAATGTGKTVMAAFDYRHLRTELSGSRLLFVAHRKEILEQSLTTFRHVLRDGSFGELWVDGQAPQRWNHVFASIQTLTNNVAKIDPARFDVLIVDEFHHAAASTYDKLLDHVTPRHLLGLTATPERADNLDILRWFGGRIAVELRLWDALEQGLLAPFHYFGVHDATDLSGVKWTRGQGYQATELTNVYTANDVWSTKVIAAVRDKIGNPLAMRALGFCVSIEHAKFMADRFRQAGFKARAITSQTSNDERRASLNDLRDGKVHVLFTVDLFNEGIDVPAIDVVLMLRPTESATIFLQQLGRGLRQEDGKDVLTVLDFVGHQAKEFRFDLRFRSLLGRSRRQLEADIEQGFPFLPAGCNIELDAVARKIVLDNVRNALPININQRITELRSLGDVSLETFLDESGLEIEDVVNTPHSWTSLRRSAGMHADPEGPEEDRLRNGLSRILHLDDDVRIALFEELLRGNAPPGIDELTAQQRDLVEGLLLTVLGTKGSKPTSLDQALQLVWQHPAIRAELLEILPLLRRNVTHLHHPIGIAGVALQVHATYTRDEALAGFGASSIVRPRPLQAGVYWHEPTQTDLFFVTLQKTERDYSPTTRYLDYAISDSLFHWESQSTTTLKSRTGQRYVNQRERGTNVALFVRQAKNDFSGRTMPYFFAGSAKYVDHQGERPIQITWRLDRPLPGDVFTDYRAAVA